MNTCLLAMGLLLDDLYFLFLLSYFYLSGVSNFYVYILFVFDVFGLLDSKHARLTVGF